MFEYQKSISFHGLFFIWDIFIKHFTMRSINAKHQRQNQQIKRFIHDRSYVINTKVKLWERKWVGNWVGNWVRKRDKKSPKHDQMRTVLIYRWIWFRRLNLHDFAGVIFCPPGFFDEFDSHD
jgi:hypothetical protein